MAARAEPFHQAWERNHATADGLSAVDHKTIGTRFLITGFLFFCLAGIEALFMRAQLATAENTLLSPDIYNQFFTMHGTTMIFFFVTPVLLGLSSFLIPLMIGARSMAFPRLNALAYWVFLFAGLFMYSSFLFDLVPNVGWFAYTPLAGPRFSPGLNLDFWSLGLVFLSISILAGAINLIVTIWKMRAPGMSLNHMPLFAWAMFIAAFVAIIAALALAAANILLMLERRFGFNFFLSAAGGNPLLSLNLFWVFGYPVLLMVFLPVIGIVSEVVGAFSRRPVLGYLLLVWSIVAAAVIGLGAWVSSIAAPGVFVAAAILFSLASLVAGVQIFTWLGTLLTGRPVWKTPLMWTSGFIFLFAVGGITGVLLAISPIGSRVSNTYFVVANLHYLLVGGVVFPILAGFTYWFPKVFGRMLGERLGKISFWLVFIGFQVTYFPMYLLGLAGMPRRVYTYAPGLGWDGLNLVATIGALMIAEGVLFFLINAIISLLRGEIAGDNPWDASSLEWAAASPPEPGNFRRIPVVNSRVPLWTAQQPGEPVSDLPPALPANDSLAPFLLAAALLVMFVGLLLSQYWLAGIGAALAIIVILAWLWLPSRSRAPG